MSPPAILQGQAARWKAVLPDWEYRLWTDEENRKLWAKHMPEVLPVYDRYKHAIERADATRLLYFMVFGGVYADLDVAPCNGVDRVLASNATKLLLVRDPVRGT